MIPALVKSLAYVYCGLALVAILLMGSYPVMLCVEEWISKRRSK